MPNVRFNLKNKNDEESLVVLIYRYEGKKLVYSTGEKINPRYWNDRSQKARETRSFPFHTEFNGYLTKLEGIVEDIYRTSKLEGKRLSVEEFKEEIDIKLGKSEIDIPPTLFEFIESFIENKKTSNSPSGSIQVYNKTFKHLKEYSSIFGTLDYDDIDLDFLDRFKKYLYSTPRSLSTNYSLKLLQNLKLFLNEATERGYNTNLEYKKKKFTIKKEDIHHIYLTIEELNSIYNLELSNNKRLEQVRDLFIIGSYTGLRFSDFSQLKPKHFKRFKEVDVIEIITQKTNQKVIIPLHPKVRSIIEKYDGILPRSISNQKMNDYLKEIGKKANISEPITSKRTKGGKLIEETKKKYDLISTHTARRSFATNSFKSGIPSLSIMKITGHTTEKSFMQYIKVNEEENALLMAENDFFRI